MPRRLNGTGGADTLPGGAALDIIRGGDGDDLIYGDGLAGPFPALFPGPGPGIPIAANTLIGGGGADVFRFGTMDTRARLPVFDTQGDVVTGFRQGQDRLDLTPFRDSFGAPPDAVFLGTDAFVDGTSFQLRSSSDGTDTRVAIFAPVFTLTGVHALLASDFILA